MFVARAPGKLVALGEYAVLDGAPAVVLAARPVRRSGDRPERGRLVPAHDARVRGRRAALRARRAERRTARRPRDVDRGRPPLAWSATIDSQALFAGSAKLGLGSSAAVLCAWAGAYRGVRAQPRCGRAGAASRGRSSSCTAGSRAGRAAVSTSPRRYTGGAITFSLARLRRAPNWFSPPAEQCRIRGYFCRPVCLYARVGCALPGVAPRSAAGGGRRSMRRLTALAEAGCAALTGDDAAAWLEAFASLRPRPAGARGSDRRGHRHGRAS